MIAIPSNQRARRMRQREGNQSGVRIWNRGWSRGMERGGEGGARVEYETALMTHQSEKIMHDSGPAIKAFNRVIARK